MPPDLPRRLCLWHSVSHKSLMQATGRENYNEITLYFNRIDYLNSSVVLLEYRFFLEKLKRFRRVLVPSFFSLSI